MEPTMANFPKIQCPFIRKNFKVDKEQWKEHGSKLGLRTPEAYLVVNEINPGYEWVLDDKDTFAVEKLNGTSCSIKTENGQILAVQNRLNVVDPLSIGKSKIAILEGMFQAAVKGYIPWDGETYGEVIGPKLQGNPYDLPTHLFYPFNKAIKDLRYRSFHEHDRTFDNWSDWFKDWLMSRFYTKRFKRDEQKNTVMAEGIVFYNLKRKAEGKVSMAKLRRDMFEWYYSDKIEIIDYDR